MGELIRLPGLVDVHVHLRDPGQTDKEDMATGTLAAVAGGFSTVFDMPNNAEPIVTVERLKQKIEIAKQKAHCDIGFHYGTLGDNIDTFAEAAEYAVGLKVYLNNTTGGYKLDVSRLRDIYESWPSHRPVLLHTEEDTIAIAMESLKGLKRRRAGRRPGGVAAPAPERRPRRLALGAGRRRNRHARLDTRARIPEVPLGRL